MAVPRLYRVLFRYFPGRRMKGTDVMMRWYLWYLNEARKQRPGRQSQPVDVTRG